MKTRRTSSIRFRVLDGARSCALSVTWAHKNGGWVPGEDEGRRPLVDHVLQEGESEHNEPGTAIS